jgi:hypothetical protein
VLGWGFKPITIAAVKCHTFSISIVIEISLVCIHFAVETTTQGEQFNFCCNTACFRELLVGINKNNATPF